MITCECLLYPSSKKIISKEFYYFQIHTQILVTSNARKQSSLLITLLVNCKTAPSTGFTSISFFYRGKDKFI